MQKRLLFLVALMLTFSLTLMAQITTSSMAGKVTLDNANGEEVIGATVVAVHEPSGTRYTAVTNTSGRFSINGMRTGGPYAVTISYIGFQPKTVKGVNLQLAETYNLNVFLTEDATELAEVVVSGKASKFAAEKTGAATNINSAQISNLPTVSRSLTDVTTQSEKKKIHINANDWDKWSHSVLISFSPKLIKGQGIRLSITTDSAIQKLVPHITDMKTSTSTNSRFQV